MFPGRHNSRCQPLASQRSYRNRDEGLRCCVVQLETIPNDAKMNAFLAEPFQRTPNMTVGPLRPLNT